MPGGANFGFGGGGAGGFDASPYLQMLLSGLQASQSQGPNAMRQRFGQAYGTHDLPSAPSELSRTSQAAQDIGSTALGFVPGAGPFLSAGASILGGARKRQVGEDFLQKLMSANPQAQSLGLKTPFVPAGKTELLGSAIGGPDVGKGALGGAAKGAGIGTAIMPGVGTAVGAGIGAIAGALGGGAAKKKAEERQKKIRQIGKENAETVQEARMRQAAQGQPQPQIHPMIPFLLQMLRMRQAQPPGPPPIEEDF